MKAYLGALLGALALTGNGFAASPIFANELEVVNVAWLPITQSLPFFIAMENGMFEKNGIKVTANKYEAPPQIIESLIANRTDAAFGAAAGLTLLAESESPGSFKVFGLQGGSNQKHRISDRLIVRKGSPISGFKDMKGRSIATLPGIQWRLLGRQMLRANDVNPDEVKFVGMPLGVQAQAVVAGTVDAALALEPIGSTAIASGEASGVVSNPGATFISEPFYSSVFVMTGKFVSEHPDAAKRIINTMNEANELANTQFDRFKVLLTKYMGVPERDLPVIGAPYFRGYAEFASEDVAAWQTMSNIFFAEGALKTKLDVRSVIFQAGAK